jgi:OFA family oxalate/formate antiporter-like MFS transporter
LCYLCPVVCAVKWFPDHKSIVTGLVVAAYPVSTIIISQIGEYLLAQQIDVLVIFRYMGFFFLVAVTITSLFMHNPAPEKRGSTENASIKNILKSRNFWGLFCAIYSASCIGLMIVGNIKPLGISLNINFFVVGAAVSVVSLANAVGRLVWGMIGSMIEGKKVILYSLISSVLVCLSAPFVVRDALSFKIFSVIAGLNFASCNVLYAAEIAHTYGPNRMGTIYSIILVGNGIAGITAPPLAGKIFDYMGSYTPAFLLFGILSSIGICLFYLLYKPVTIDAHSTN